MVKKIEIDIYATLLLIMVIQTIVEVNTQSFGINLFRLIIIALMFNTIKNKINNLKNILL